MCTNPQDAATIDAYIAITAQAVRCASFSTERGDIVVPKQDGGNGTTGSESDESEIGSGGMQWDFDHGIVVQLMCHHIRRTSFKQCEAYKFTPAKNIG